MIVNNTPSKIFAIGLWHGLLRCITTWGSKRLVLEICNRVDVETANAILTAKTTNSATASASTTASSTATVTASTMVSTAGTTEPAPRYVQQVSDSFHNMPCSRKTESLSPGIKRNAGM